MMKDFHFSRKRIATILIVLVAVLLVMDLNSRLGDLFRLSRKRNIVNTQVAGLELTRDVLKSRIAYATSEAAVEDWARNEAHMVQPGDQPIIPLSTQQATPTRQFVPSPTPFPYKNWQIWQALFFGE